MSTEGQINSIFRKMQNSSENALIKRENKSFEERKTKAMEKAETILENANMVKIAGELLNKFPIEEINMMTEEEIDAHCSPYDAAVIVAIAQKIEIKKQEAN